MSAPLSEQQLAEIQDRVLSATPGPWESYTGYGESFYAHVRGEMLLPVGTLDFGDSDTADADRLLVEHAAEDLAALLADNTALRDVLAQVAKTLQSRGEGPTDDALLDRIAETIATAGKDISAGDESAQPEQLRARIANLETAARSAAVMLRSAAALADSGQSSRPGALRTAATCLDEAAGGGRT